MPTAFSTLLKATRESARMSDWELARDVGVSERTVRNWESGATRPNQEQLARISDALRMSARKRREVADLYTWSS